MKPRTLSVLRRLAHQKLTTLQQEMAKLQGRHQSIQQNIAQLDEQTRQERCTNVPADAYFEEVTRQKNLRSIELTQIENEINALQQRIIKAWQKDEMLKMLPE